MHTAVRVFFITVAITLFALLGAADQARAAECGGNGQPPCAYSKAKYHGKSCKGAGKFWDPRNGGECWSCARGYKRTAAAVTARDACIRPAYTKYKKAKKGRKNTRVGQGCPKGYFWDVKGGNGLLGRCYSCSGYKRTASSVTSKKACSSRIKAKRARAKHHGSGCGEGQFWDPQKGGECWSCPKGMGRSLTKVTAANACSMPLTKQAVKALKGETVGCGKGMIEYGNKCWKKGDCGKKVGARACTLGERVPSCDKGLREKTGTCVKLKPGEVPFLASLGDYSKDLAAEGGKECIRVLDILPALRINGIDLKDTTKLKYFFIGFSCSVTQELDQISHVTDVINAAGGEIYKKPCSKAGTVGRYPCGLGMAMIVRDVESAACMVDTLKDAKLVGDAGKMSLREKWLQIGEMSYTVVQAARALRDLFKKAKEARAKKRDKKARDDIRKARGKTKEERKALEKRYEKAKKILDSDQAAIDNYAKSKQYKAERAEREKWWREQEDKNPAEIKNLEKKHVKEVNAQIKAEKQRRREDKYLSRLDSLNDKLKVFKAKLTISNKVLRAKTRGSNKLQSKACNGFFEG